MTNKTIQTILVVLGLAILFQSCATLDLATATDYDVNKVVLSKMGTLDATVTTNKMEMLVEMQNKIVKKFNGLKEGEVLVVFPDVTIGSEVAPSTWASMGAALATGSGQFQAKRRPTVEITYLKMDSDLALRWANTIFGQEQLSRTGVMKLHYGQSKLYVGNYTMGWVCNYMGL